MISKPTIIISSLGRTGTTFFADFFNAMLLDCHALHEPDILSTKGRNKGFKGLIKQVDEMGMRRLWLKVGGSWSLVKLSDDRFKGKIDTKTAVKMLSEQRESFINSKPGNIYVESNLGYYGLLDVLEDVFVNFRAIYLIRDARTWVQSVYNFGQKYNKKGFRKLVCHNWPRADELSDNPYKDKWAEMDRFVRICWAWRYLNEFALNSIEKSPNIRLYKFEDIFTSTVEDSKIPDLLDYISGLQNIKMKCSRDEALLFLKNKINPSKKNGLSEYNNWTSRQKKFFEDICGPLMNKLDYK